MRKVVSSLVLGMVSMCPQVAWGADAAPAAGAAPAEPAAAPATAPSEGAPAPAAAEPIAPAEGAAPGATAPDKDSGLVADAEAGGSPVELPGKTYMFVGARYRAIIVPKFMMNLFGDGGKTVVVHGFGPEFAFRKNAFEYNLSAWFASYSMHDTAFKSKDDGANAWELIDSNLKSLFLTADFLWSQDFSPEFSLNYGLAGGFGIIFGDLHRVQAKPGGPGADSNTGEGFVKCSRAGDTITGTGDASFCDTSNKRYPGSPESNEKSWTDGGSKPILFPWFVLQTGLRYKPHKNFAARLDAGFGTSGFFLGLGLDYGL